MSIASAYLSLSKSDELFNKLYYGYILNKGNKNEKITTRNTFNENIDEWKNLLMLKYIVFGDKFNQSVNYLPPNILYLEFGKSFNQKLEKLPLKITHLILGHNYNKSTKYLPESIIWLEISKYFNLNLSLNLKVQHIVLNSLKLCCTDLPDTLKYLSIGSINNNFVITKYPSQLTHIIYYSKILHKQILMSLPYHVTNIIFAYKSWTHTPLLIPPSIFFNHEFTNLLQNISCIKFDINFNNNVDNLPKNMLEIIFGNKFNQTVNLLPSTLISIKLGVAFNQTIDNLPKSLRYLFLSSHFNNKIDNLPPNLFCIKFFNIFNQKIDHLPNSLVYLIFNMNSNFKQSLNYLPSSLIYLALGHKFNNHINNLPSSITNLSFIHFNLYINHLTNIKILDNTVNKKYKFDFIHNYTFPFI